MTPRFRATDSLPQKTIAWLLRPTPRAWSVGAYSVLAAVCVLFAVQASASRSLAGRVARDEVTQAQNRAANVLTWCDAINTLEHGLFAYVSQFRHVPALHLKRLRCQKLADRTLKSAGLLAGAEHPGRPPPAQ